MTRRNKVREVETVAWDKTRGPSEGRTWHRGRPNTGGRWAHLGACRRAAAEKKLINGPAAENPPAEEGTVKEVAARKVTAKKGSAGEHPYQENAGNNGKC